MRFYKTNGGNEDGGGLWIDARNDAAFVRPAHTAEA
jgi:hypothetical protein